MVLLDAIGQVVYVDPILKFFVFLQDRTQDAVHDVTVVSRTDLLSSSGDSHRTPLPKQQRSTPLQTSTVGNLGRSLSSDSVKLLNLALG